MVVGTKIRHAFGIDASKTVNIKLSLEGLLVLLGLLEIAGHDHVGKHFGLMRPKGFAVRKPRDNWLVSLRHRIIEHFMELEREGQLWRSSEEARGGNMIRSFVCLALYVKFS
jgi:hypothetical protein